MTIRYPDHDHYDLLRSIYSMASHLVTGVTGLIGSHLIKELSKNNDVYAISRRPDKDISSLTRLIQADLSKPLNTDLFPKNINSVIHLAQSEHFRDFPQYAEELLSVNTIATHSLLQYAIRAGATTFIYASSGGVYGYGEEGFRENEPIEASGSLGFYLSTKLCSEILAENYSPYITVILLRFFFVYGPGQRSSMLIPRLVNSVRQGSSIQLQGEDGIRINPTYVTDACDSIIEALHLKDSQKINIGGPEVLTLRRIGTIIGEEVGKSPSFDVQSEVKPRHIFGDIKKMSVILKPPRVHFREGIKSILASE